MNYNFRNVEEVAKARERLEKLIAKGSRCEIKETNIRTSQQNRAIHLYYKLIAIELNESGATYKYQGITGKEFEMPYNPKIVKEYIWRPLQKELFGEKSTTKLNTKMINEIVDVITNAFANMGLVVEFPKAKKLINDEE